MWRQHTRHAHIRDTTRHITKTTKSISILDNVHSFRVRIVRSNHSSWQMKIICQTMGVKMCDYSWIDHAIVSATCDTCTLLKTQCLSTSLAAWNNNKKTNKTNYIAWIWFVCGILMTHFGRFPWIAQLQKPSLYWLICWPAQAKWKILMNDNGNSMGIVQWAPLIL